MNALTSMFVAAALLTAAPAFAQDRPGLPRGDVAAYAGWLAVDEDVRRQFSSSVGWENTLLGAVGAGWYWTEHFKLEVDSSASTTARAYRVETMVIDGLPAYQSSETAFTRRSAGTSLQYQYGRNAWFHPHLGAGIDLTWERRTTRYGPLIQPGSLRPRVIRDGYTEGPATTMRIRPVVAAGFKGYLAPRIFFRSDLRLVFRRGLEESRVRAGFGIDL